MGRQGPAPARVPRADGQAPPGRPLSPPPQDEVLFASKRNLTDLDSRIMRDKGALTQAYNAQAVVGDGQVIIAAELTNRPTDVRELEPMISAARRELAGPAAPGAVSTRVLADNGYWNNARSPRSQPRPDRDRRPRRRYRATAAPRAPRQGPQADRIRALLATQHGQRALPPPPTDHRARLRPHQIPARHHPPRPPRPHRLPGRMEADRRHPQPAQALPRTHAPRPPETAGRRGSPAGPSNSPTAATHWRT